MTYDEAEAYLEQMGITYVNRVPDPEKSYENSITLDLTSAADSSTLRVASVRGTLAEGHPMISRIGDFDRLYIEPEGHNVVFVYDDRPGVVAAVGTAFANNNINIEDLRQPHNEETGRSIAIVKTNQAVSDDIVSAIASEIGADISFYILF